MLRFGPLYEQSCLLSPVFYGIFCVSHNVWSYLGLDPCVDGAARCHQYAECIPEGNNYRCQCRTGFIGDGTDCQGNTKSMTSQYHQINDITVKPNQWHHSTTKSMTPQQHQINYITVPPNQLHHSTPKSMTSQYHQISDITVKPNQWNHSYTKSMTSQ